VGELVRRALDHDGVRVITGRVVTRARRVGPDTVVTLDDGTTLAIDVVVLGAGRRPRGAELGLAGAGVEVDGRGAVVVDDRCRAGEGLWAVGDVTGIALFTHVAKYQGRVVADNILGRERRARYDGIPRVVFADPEIAAVGLDEEQARRRGIDLATAEVDLAEAIARPWTYERDPAGTLGLLADRTRRVLVGAWAVAPLAGEWIHQATLAVRAEIPLDVLLDQVAQFPTYSEGYLAALERLDL
jgi:pyruvate/2-oxoglutarate dehydrogenase complex dihydrolipoamide dehydrogenase (E3) component